MIRVTSRSSVSATKGTPLTSYVLTWAGLTSQNLSPRYALHFAREYLGIMC